jgi:hypothetical protein
MIVLDAGSILFRICAPVSHIQTGMQSIKTKRKRILPIAIIVILLQFSASAQGNWKLVKNENGIKIYSKPEPGSGYNAFKAEMQVNCMIKDVVDVLKNTKNNSSWVPNCKVMKLLKTDGNDQYYYIETILPWPLDNRDMVYRFHYEEVNAKQVKINITGIPGYIQPKTGIERITKANGYWLLTYVDTKKTSISYQMHVEPGGIIPSWLANAYISDAPFSTFTELRKLIQK